MNKPSAYEKQALKEIHAWKNPKIGWCGYAMKAINWPLDKAGDLVFKTPLVGDVIRRSVQGITHLCNDIAQYSVRQESIYAEFHKNGHTDINKPDDIFSLDLEQVDHVVSWLDTKYKGIALIEGAGTGALGAPGIPADIAALITLTLRAIGEYATYYGFNVSSQRERLFVMNVLSLASSPNDSSKGLAIAQLVRIAQDTAKKRTWKELEKHAFVKVMQQISKTLGIRLTKAKLAQSIPIAGATIGGGFNAYFTAKVCDAAFYLYRERYLAVKYGAEVIDAPVEPSTDFNPHYPDEDESIPQ